METTLRDKTRNQINTIHPYKDEFGWYFDDESVGLYREAFVAGIPEVIESLVGEAKSFTAHISKDPMPGETCVLDRVMGTGEDGWYRLRGTELEGWLCPAVLKYFERYPASIHITIKLNKNG